MGRAYLAAGEKEKAGSAFRNLYLTLPNSSEADVGGTELRKARNFGLAIRAPQPRRSAIQSQHYGEAAHDTATSPKKSVRRTGQMCNWHWRSA